MFYAATQALLYVLCYRLPHIMELSHACGAPAAVGPAARPGAPAGGAGAPAPAAAAGPADVRALRQLLRAVMPELLGHRCCPGRARGPACERVGCGAYDLAIPGPCRWHRTCRRANGACLAVPLACVRVVCVHDS